MSKYLKALKLSEAREALAVHRRDWKPDAGEAWTARDAELAGAVIEGEREYREELRTATKEPAPKPLTDRIECRHYLDAAIEGRAVAGAERELNQELGLPDHAMPWEAIEPRGVEPRTEDRTDDATTVSDDVAGQPQMRVIRRVFDKGNVSFLGIGSPMVAYGEPNYPIMGDELDSDNDGTALGGGQAGEGRGYEAGTAVEADVVTFTRQTVEPKRLSARYLMRLEDMAKFPALEDILRADLRTVMTNLRDRQVLGGIGAHTGVMHTDHDIDGVLDTLPEPKKGTAANQNRATGVGMIYTQAGAPTKVTADSLQKMLHDFIDGRYSSMAGDWRWLMGTATYRMMATERITGVDDFRHLLDVFRFAGVSYRPSAYIPDLGKARTIDAVTDAQDMIGVARPSDAVAPVWQGITMIRDPYSGAAKAELAITAHALIGFKILRAHGWVRTAVKLA